MQETKVAEADLPDEVREPYGYQSVWHSAERKGYSGVAVLTKKSPTNVITGFGNDRFDCEGRVIQAEFDDTATCTGPDIYSSGQIYAPQSS